MAGSEFVVDFPTLANLQDAWITAHCRQFDMGMSGEPFVLTDEQLYQLAHFYRVRTDAQVAPGEIIFSQAFTYRRGQIIGPQKNGKSPFATMMAVLEACGPSQFAGWAAGGELYLCSDHGCDCGFGYEYLPGEPMGTCHPSPLVVLLARAQEQVDNVFEPLIQQCNLGVLPWLKARLEDVKIIRDGRTIGYIYKGTAAAQSKLGKRFTFAVMDETGTWTSANRGAQLADTIRRSLGGMQGRSIEITNPYDSAEQSVAQLTQESRAADIYKYWRKPPAKLRWADADERRKIVEFNYRYNTWINVDAILAEAAELSERDPAQAERFYGNRVVFGSGAWLTDQLWQRAYINFEPGEDIAQVAPPKPGTRICLGFDGSENNDWTAIKAVTRDGFLFTPRWGEAGQLTIWDPREHGDRIPREQVMMAFEEIFSTYRVERLYCDPHDWRSEIAELSERYGVVAEWDTSRYVRMCDAVRTFEIDLMNGRLVHDGCELTTRAVFNAKKRPRPGDRYDIVKPTEHQKIDAAVAAVIAYAAAVDASVVGWRATATDGADLSMMVCM